jgi:hypothetical protein
MIIKPTILTGMDKQYLGYDDNEEVDFEASKAEYCKQVAELAKETLTDAGYSVGDIDVVENQGGTEVRYCPEEAKDLLQNIPQQVWENQNFWVEKTMKTHTEIAQEIINKIDWSEFAEHFHIPAEKWGATVYIREDGSTFTHGQGTRPPPDTYVVGIRCAYDEDEKVLDDMEFEGMPIDEWERMLEEAITEQLQHNEEIEHYRNLSSW